MKKTVKPQIQKIISINVTYRTIKTPQSVLKMSALSPDISRETATPLTESYNNNPIVKLPAFD